MEREELFDYLSWFFAYDTGSTDTGIKDNFKKSQLKKYLHQNLDTKDKKELLCLTDNLLGEFVREYFLTEEQMRKGYGLEDVKCFIDWLGEEMDLSY